MLYYTLKFITWIALKAYYRQIIVTGMDKVPASGPVIYACNHPNSFLDACIIGVYSKRQIYFLARADVFNAPWKAWILSKLHVIPIYRLQEGAENLEKNRDTFDRCNQIFKKGGIVLIFSEGICVQEMRLRPLKKGTARLALDYSSEGSSLKVVPIGSNYMKPTQFRKTTYLTAGQPFDANEFTASYIENNARGILAFNKSLEEVLRSVVIHISDKENEKAVTTLVEIVHNDGASLKELIHMVDSLMALRQNDPEKYEMIIRKAESYRRSLEKNKTEDSATKDVSGPGILYYPAVLLYHITKLVHIIPYSLAEVITRKFVKLPEFVDSVLVACRIVFSFIFFLLVTGITAAFNLTAALIVILIFILCGRLSSVLYDFTNHGKLQKRLASIPLSELQAIRQARKEILLSLKGLV